MTSRPQFTEQQSAAILTRGTSIALSAGAGCGKTFVLTQRYLAALEPENSTNPEADLHSLVAITFTERAAREMRDRIRAACNERLRDCLLEDVKHWLTILRGLDAARISTIHSFCTGLLRTQAVEAGLDPRFAVLEPPLADALLRRVIRDSFHRLIEIEDADATQFVIDFGLERAKELLRRLTRQRFQIEFATFAEVSAAQLEADWLRRWQTKFVPMLIEQFRSSPAVAHAMAAISDSPSTHSAMMERFANLRQLLSGQATWQDNVQALNQVRENAMVKGGGKNDWASDDAKEKVGSAFKKLRDSIDKLTERLDVRREDVVTATLLACRALRLTQRMAHDYEAAKRTEGVLDFDDLLLHARNLLRDNSNVRQRVAAGIRLLMVDEFQDTDPVQADLVRNLCGAAFTQGKLFMVGDRKQSIYRFRRADPTVFTKMSDELPSPGRLPLNVNFRSQPAVLNFVNHLFAPAMEGYEFLTPFSVEQYSPTPAIEFLFATFDANDSVAAADDESEVDSAAALISTDADTRPNAARLRAREADWIARRIAALLNDPTPRIRTKSRDANGRPVLRSVAPGDIVILFRALSNVQEYESALRRYGLHYYLVGGKAFFAQQEVFDLLNLCQYLDDCDDLVALVGLLRSPFFNLSDDALQALAFYTKPGSDNDFQSRAATSLHRALYLDPPTLLPEEQQVRIRFASEVLTELRAKKDCIPLVDLLNSAIERTGYDASLLCEFLGSRKLANLRKLVEMAWQFDQDQFTLKDFASRLQTSVLEETDEEFATTLPESGDVIRLMSIHQSKGLEFPVVIVADIDRKGPPQGSNAVLHPQLGALVKPPEKFGLRAKNLGIDMHTLAEQDADAQEAIRLFYVACTRAADYLILSTGLDDSKPSRSPWFELIESRFDIHSGLPKSDPLLGSSKSATAGREAIPEIRVHPKPCPIKRRDDDQDKQAPLSQLPGSILSAEPSEFPTSARIFPRDVSDVATISVSTLEAIDERLSGRKHAPRPRQSTEMEDESIDVDMATSLGTIVHAVLERVDFRDTSNWTEILSSVVAQSHDVPSDDVIEQARTMLSRFIDSSIADLLAGSKSIHREIDFLLPWPLTKTSNAEKSAGSDDLSQPMIAGIIDLLVETDDGWHIFDYKTGDFPVRTPDEQFLVPYELQLGVYAYAVEQWFGCVPKEISLITFKPNVRRITLEWSSDRWQSIRTRIDRAIADVQFE